MERRSGTEYHVSTHRSATIASSPPSSSSSYPNKDRGKSRCEEANSEEYSRRHREHNTSSNHVSHHHHHKQQQQQQQQQQEPQHVSSRTRNNAPSSNGSGTAPRETPRSGKSSRNHSHGGNSSTNNNVNKDYASYPDDLNHVSQVHRSSRNHGDRGHYDHNGSRRSSRTRNQDEYDHDDREVSSVRSSRHGGVSSTRGEYSDRSSDTTSVKERSESRERMAGDDEAYYHSSSSQSFRRHRDNNSSHRRSHSRQRIISDQQEVVESRGYTDHVGYSSNSHEGGDNHITQDERRTKDSSYSSRRSRVGGGKDVCSDRYETVPNQRYDYYDDIKKNGGSSKEHNSENRRRTSSTRGERRVDNDCQRVNSRRREPEADNASEEITGRRRFDESNQKVLQAEIYPEPDSRRKDSRNESVNRSRRSSSSQNIDQQDETEFRRRSSGQRQSSQDLVTSRRHTGESDRQRQGSSRRTISRNNSLVDENNVSNENAPLSHRDQQSAERYHSTPKDHRRRRDGSRCEILSSESRHSMTEDSRRRDNGRHQMYPSDSRHSNVAHDQFYDVSTVDRRSYGHRNSESDTRHHESSSSRRRRSVSSYDEPEISHTHHFRRDNSLSNRSSSSRSNHDTGFHSSASSPRREESISRFSSDISPSRFQDDEVSRQLGYEGTKNRRRTRNTSSNNNSLDVPQAPLRKDRSLSSSGRGDSSFEEPAQEPDIKKIESLETNGHEVTKPESVPHNNIVCNGDIVNNEKMFEREKDLNVRNEGNVTIISEKSIISQEESPRAECTSSTSTLRGGNMTSKPSFVGSISSLLSRDPPSDRSFSIGSVGERWRKLRQGIASDQASTSSFASETASLFSSAASRFMNSLPGVPKSFPKAFTSGTPQSDVSKSSADKFMPDQSRSSFSPESGITKDNKTEPLTNNSNIISPSQSNKSPIKNSNLSTNNNNNNNNKSQFDGVNDTLSPRESLASTSLSLHSKAANAYVTNNRHENVEEEEEEELLTPESEESGQMTPPPMDMDMKRRSKEVDGELTSFLPAEMSRREEKFHDAARMNDAVAIRTILKEKVNINCRNSLDRTALHWAAANGNLAAVEALTDGGADLEAKDKYGMRAILWAAWFGHIPVLQALVNAGANTKIANKQGLGILHCAAENNHAAVVAFIFESLEPHNVDQTDKNDRTPLHAAAESGHVQAVDVLLQAQADLHKKDKGGKTCVHLASQHGHADVLKILLLQGVEVDDRDVDGKTALHLASEGGHKDIVDLLLDYTANPNSETVKEITPLHMAAMEGHVEVCTSLVKYGCNVNAQNFQGNTALHLAANANHKDVARVLVDAKCETDLPNSRLQTPLHIAVESGHLEVVQTLLAGGASLEAREKVSGKSALQLAARGNYVSVVDMLIKAERYYAIARDYHDNDVGYVDPDTYLRNASHPNAAHMKEVLWKLATKQLKQTDWKKLAHYWHFTPEHIKAIEQEYTGTMSYKDHGYRLLLIWLHGVRKDENVLKLLFEALSGIEKRHLAESIRRKANMAAEKDKPCSPAVCAVS